MEASAAEFYEQRREAMYGRILAKLDEMVTRFDHILDSSSSSLACAASPASTTTVSSAPAIPLTSVQKVFEEMLPCSDVAIRGDLHVMVSHVVYPVTEEVLHCLFDPYGAEKVQVLMENTQVEALISFHSAQDAIQAREACQGLCIWDGCNMMDIYLVLPAALDSIPKTTSKSDIADSSDNHVALVSKSTDCVPKFVSTPWESPPVLMEKLFADVENATQTIVENVVVPMDAISAKKQENAVPTTMDVPGDVDSSKALLLVLLAGIEFDTPPPAKCSTVYSSLVTSTPSFTNTITTILILAPICAEGTVTTKNEHSISIELLLNYELFLHPEHGVIQPMPPWPSHGFNHGVALHMLAWPPPWRKALVLQLCVSCVPDQPSCNLSYVRMNVADGFAYVNDKKLEVLLLLQPRLTTVIQVFDRGKRFKLPSNSQPFHKDSSLQDIQPKTFPIKLWPPSDSSRLMLVEGITIESIFSRKYGLFGKEDAHESANRIEEEYFSADKHFKQEPGCNGSSAVQLYAKETSKIMLEVLKRGPKTTAAPETPVVNAPCEPTDTVFDMSGDKHDFIEADEAKELLGPLTEPGNSCRRIYFSNRSFGIAAPNVTGPILESIENQLTEVDISDFVAGRPEDKALGVMCIFSKALAGSGGKGVRAFTDLLKSLENLEELYVMNDGISEEVAAALFELIPSLKFFTPTTT